MTQNEEEIDSLQKQKQEIEAQTKEALEAKEKEINDLKKNIDHLQSEFAKMLGDTLTKIKNKIEEANKNWEEENDSKMLKSYEELANKAQMGQ